MKTREELIEMLGTEIQVGMASQYIVAFDKNYSNQELNEILNAPTEEQQSCEMCHATLSGRAYTVDDYQHQIKNFVSGLNPDAIKNIKCCQWCGRKLGDE